MLANGVENMNKRLLGYFFLALMLLSCLGVCEGAKAKTVTIVDGTGQSVNVSLPVDRIVCISSRASEIVCALGDGDKIVGRDSYSFFPTSLEDVPVVAESSYNPDVELIHKINPDLVVADSMLSDDNRKKIESGGIPVIVETALDPTTIATFVNHLGIILDKEDRAGEIISFIEKYQDIVKERTASLKAEDKPKVFFEFAQPYNTAASGTTFHNLTTAAGGINIAADEPVQYPVVEPEWVVKRDPDVIFSYATANTAEENLTKKMKETRDELLSRPELSDVKAIKDGRVYILGDPVAWGIRSIVGELYLAKWFHPDLFKDIDPEAVQREIHQQFFGEELKEKCVYP
jgi:iron complex transport system substrate-binding protein